MEYLLDTDTCIDLLRGLRPVVRKLEKLSPEDCAISAITTFELFAGAAKSRQPSNEIDKIERLVSVLEEISFEGPDLEPKHQVIDAAYVEGMLSETVKDQDLSRYIL